MPRMRQNTPQIRRVADADLISACQSSMPNNRQKTPQMRSVAEADLSSACSKRAQCEGSKDPNQKPAWIISTCQKKATNAKPESIMIPKTNQKWRERSRKYAKPRLESLKLREGTILRVEVTTWVIKATLSRA